MLEWLSKPFLHRGRWSRRALLRAGAVGVGGLMLPRLPASQSAAPRRRCASRCIFVFLNGGQSQLDTFDMKPLAPSGVRGPYRSIATSVPGLSICEKLPRLAQWMHKVAVIRSMTHNLSAHNSSAAYALSGRSPGSDAAIAPTATDHPTFGSVVARLSPPQTLPPFVLTPTYLFDMGFPTPSAGGGWLGRSFDPFPVVRNQMMSASPVWTGELPVPSGMNLTADMTSLRVRHREALRCRLSAGNAAEAAHDEHRRRAMELILSPEAQSAFDLSREPASVRDRYGRFEMGQVLLLARRMIEAGVRFVTANAVSNPPSTRLSAFQIWDTHFDHFRLYDSHLLPEFDQALSALLGDLADRGLLDDTLVLVMGEFGRTPRINNADGGGRDHWSRAYSALLAGGPIRGGIIHGRTDAVAGEVRDFPVRPDDLAATLYKSLGIPHDTMLHDLRQRPHRIAEGEPVRALFG
ncbi:MAG: DUF1501 domain-containing protein [Planctomycetes bacterium]|nr:DUF1501 domain-containing protein [Planctomycetota bacterium]